MEKEQLIAKKVKHQFNGKETLFSIDSLNTHFDGLLIHESDILTDEFEDQDEGYVRIGDVNFDNATPKEVKPVEEIEIDAEEVKGEGENLRNVLEEDPKKESTEKEEELKITSDQPEYGTEDIVYNKSAEEVDLEIKSDNEKIKESDITDASDIPGSVQETVVEDVKEEIPAEESVAEAKPKKETASSKKK